MGVIIFKIKYNLFMVLLYLLLLFNLVTEKLPPTPELQGIGFNVYTDTYSSAAFG